MNELQVDEAALSAFTAEPIAEAAKELYRHGTVVYGWDPCSGGDLPAVMMKLEAMGLAGLTPYCCEHHARKGGSCDSKGSILSIHGLHDRLASWASWFTAPTYATPLCHVTVARLTPLGREALSLCYERLGLNLDEIRPMSPRKLKRIEVRKFYRRRRGISLGMVRCDVSSCGGFDLGLGFARICWHKFDKRFEIDKWVFDFSPRE